MHDLAFTRPVLSPPLPLGHQHSVLLERELLVLGAILGDDVDVDEVARINVTLTR